MEAFPIQSRDPEKRAITRALRVALVVSVAIAVILLGLLVTASGNTRLFEDRYPVVLGLAGLVALMLLALVLELLRRLLIRYRRGLFGTRLMARMAGSFVLMTVLPVALVFLVAVQFVGRSIESWFDVPLERALDSGLSLARTSLDAMLADLTKKSRVMAAELADTPAPAWSAAMARLREQSGAQEAVVMTGSGRIVLASGGQFAQLVPDLPSADALRQVRLTRQYARVETIADPASPGLKLRVIVPVLGDAQRLDDSRYLQLVQPVPSALAENAEAVQQGFRDFQQLSLSRTGLKHIFRITLTLTFLLTVFAAVAGAFLLAGWLTGPLSQLAAATRSVAEGDFRPVKDYTGRDELGVLTRSFNDMTRQLQEARSLVQRNQEELERVNARLGSVLANLDAGVLVFDVELRLRLANPGADRILDADLSRQLGEPLAALPGIGDFVEPIRAAFNELAAAGDARWQRQFALGRAADPSSAGAQGSASAGGKTLLARGSILPGEDVGYVIVFDDVSGVVAAQRALAWAEVARRLAHEIKNPLTPIQLAAERMAHKLRERLPPADAELLVKNTQTIVNQVQALKTLVDEFRDYARLPAAQLVPLQLNELLEDLLRLYAGGESGSAIRARLAPDAPMVLGDATQLRQVFHNLLKNALEAGGKGGREPQAAGGAAAAVPAAAAAASAPAPAIEVVTERVALADGAPALRVTVSDHGGGFDPGMLTRVFEPYVTSKVRGTGLGLAIVRKIVDEHGARIDVGNWLDEQGRTAGAQVAILFTKLPKSVENPPIHEAG